MRTSAKNKKKNSDSGLPSYAIYAEWRPGPKKPSLLILLSRCYPFGLRRIGATRRNLETFVDLLRQSVEVEPCYYEGILAERPLRFATFGPASFRKSAPDEVRIASPNRPSRVARRMTPYQWCRARRAEERLRRIDGA